MSEKYISTAKVIDGVLILSLPDAVSPVVWQMELGQSKSSALEVRNTPDGQFQLTLKTPRQDVLDIATYANRDQAVKALLATSQAMERAQGQLKSVSSHSYPVPAVSYSNQSSGFLTSLKKFLLFIVKLIAALVVIGLLLFIGTKLFLGGGTPSSSNSASIPMSADEFLEKQ